MMSTRSDYTADEWEAIRRTPAEAVIAVEQASPSGFFGRRRERKAEEKGFAQAIAQYAGLGLIDAIVAAKDEEGRLVDSLRAGGEPMVDRAVDTAGKARRAIQAKGTRQELEAFVGAILGTAEAVALAAGEGGEADKISEPEAILLRRIASALGKSEYEPPKDRWTAFSPSQLDL
jgi:hypothetical protein